MWKIDYLGFHERKYQRMKADGRSGWSDEEAAQEMLDIVNNALQMKGITKLGRLLELGCGDGSVTLTLADRGFHVYGIDIAPTAIAWAQEKAKDRDLQGQFQVGNVTELPYSDGFFDVVLDADCSHCIIGGDRKLFFSNAFRVLKPDGLFIMMAMCGEPVPNLKDAFDPATRCLVRDGVAGRYIGLPKGILEELESTGFHILHGEIVTFQEPDMQDEIVAYAVKP